MGAMAPAPRQPLASISMENMDRYRRRKDGSVRSLPEIKRAVRLHLPISPGEERVLREAIAPAEKTHPDDATRDDGTATLEAPAEEATPEVDAAVAEQEIKDKDLTGAAADAVKHPEETEMELAPPGPDHEALTAHDDAIAGSYKAIVAMERANGPADKLTAVQELFDAATSHKAVSRQFDALAGHMQEHDLVGAPKARAAAKAHRDAAMAMERAATTGQGDHYRKAHAAVKKTEESAKTLGETLKDESKKRAVKGKKDRKAEKLAAKADPAKEALRSLGRIQTRKLWGRNLKHHAPVAGAPKMSDEVAKGHYDAIVEHMEGGENDVRAAAVAKDPAKRAALARSARAHANAAHEHFGKLIEAGHPKAADAEYHYSQVQSDAAETERYAARK